jgi:oxidoreductase FAD/NAD(P)-binding domain protein
MERYVAKVTRIHKESSDTITIYFRVEDDKQFIYTAGQYITVFFDDSSTPEGKAYSLSSAPHEDDLSITVKRVGEYSGKLHDLKPGDTFMISAAYGYFNPETSRPLVCISAGCGLAPIWSIVKDELRRDKGRLAHVFFSNRDAKEIPFHEALNGHEQAHDSLTVHHHITRNKQVPVNMHRGRIDLDACVKAVEGEVNYLLCGSVEFVRDMWRGLVDRGVSSSLISTETFFE